MALLAASLLDGSAPGRASLQPIGNFEPDKPARASGMFWVIDGVPGSDRTMVWHNGQTGGLLRLPRDLLSMYMAPSRTGA
jgi:hypothetical protein